MFKKILARFGKGAATVDLRFENRSFTPGEEVKGEICIQGGEVEQIINSLAVRLMMSVRTPQGSAVREVGSIRLNAANRILPKEQQIVAFSYELPTNLAITRNNVSYYFDTELDIEGGVDRSDVDRLTVDFPANIQNLFRVLSSLGFREKHESGKLDQYGQEFAFFPTEFLNGSVNEVEFRFAQEENGLYVWMEVDCRNGFHEIEAKREFFLEEALLLDEQKLTNILKQYLAEASERPHSYSQPFSYSVPGGYRPRSSNPMGGMIGGLAMGVFGGVLLSEMMGSAVEAMGLDDEMEEVEDFDLGDIFGGDED
jgi:sporulation-control protein